MKYRDESIVDYIASTARTQESIAEELQLTQGTVSKWLRSTRDIIIRIYSNGKIEAYERQPLKRLGRALVKGGGKKAA